MNIEIRPLAQTDNAAWRELFAGYLHFYKTELTQEQIELTFKRLLDPNFNLYGKVVEIDGKPLGLAHFSYQTSSWASKDYCYLEDLFVSPESRGQGLGRALIESVKAEAISHGSSRLYWNTDADNSTARKLYNSFTLESGKVQYRISLS